MHELQEWIQRQAAARGFAEVGFARADAVRTREAWLAWLEAGHHADMQWLEKVPEKRSDPRNLFEGARTVVVFGASYAGPAEAPHDPARGRIARYARGRDYHDVMFKSLKRLKAELLERWPEVRARAWVDTGPLLERYWAGEAGIGWVGKHGGLVSQRHGCWLLLGVMLLDVALLPDDPVADRCGSCTRCLDACPTDAFVQPYVLDARRCLSYWSIEARGPIPEEFRGPLGDRVFGCDDCYAVCPWNRDAPPGMKELEGRPENEHPRLLELLQLDVDGFRARFPKSPVKRAKRAGLVRNVAIAAGNARLHAAQPLLQQLRTDTEPGVAEAAAWAQARIRQQIPGEAPDG